MKNLTSASVLMVLAYFSAGSMPASAQGTFMFCNHFSALDTNDHYNLGCTIDYLDLKQYVIPDVEWIANAQGATGNVSHCGGTPLSPTPSTSDTLYYYDYPQEHPVLSNYYYFSMTTHIFPTKWWQNNGVDPAWWQPVTHYMTGSYKQNGTIILHDGTGNVNHTFTPTCP